MRFLFDENMPRDLALALGQLSKVVLHTREIPELGRRALDEQVIAYASDHSLFVVTRDCSMAKEPWFRADVKRLGAGVFFVRTCRIAGKEMRLWPLAQLVVKGWDNMEQFAASNRAPFVALMQSNGHVSTY